MSFSDGFEHAQEQTGEDIAAAVKDGVIVLDTNVLLDLYRYSGDAQESLVEVLTAIADRIWIPYQVRYEFFRSRTNLNDRNLIENAEKARNVLVERLRSVWSRAGYASEQKDVLEAKIRKTFQDALSEIDWEVPQRFDDDKIFDLLDRFTVGDQPDPDDFKKMVDEGLSRQKANRPPGTSDTSGPVNGDYVLWRQLLDRVKEGTVVLLVTNDAKIGDWYESDEQNELEQPLRALVKEMLSETGCVFRICKLDTLLYHADEVGVVVKPSVTEAVKKSQRDDDEWQAWLSDARSKQSDAERFADRFNKLSEPNQKLAEMIAANRSLSKVMAPNQKLAEMIAANQSLSKVMAPNQKLAEMIAANQSLSKAQPWSKTAPLAQSAAKDLLGDQRDASLNATIEHVLRTSEDED